MDKNMTVFKFLFINVDPQPGIDPQALRGPFLWLCIMTTCNHNWEVVKF